MDLPPALLFDVFGTCVDWRRGVIREGGALGDRLGLGEVDRAALADAWRALYQPQMDTVRSGARPWTTSTSPAGSARDRLARATASAW